MYNYIVENILPKGDIMNRRIFYNIIISAIFFMVVAIIINLVFYAFLNYAFEKPINWGFIFGNILGMLVARIYREFFSRR